MFKVMIVILAVFCRSAGVKSPPPEALLTNRLNKREKIDG